MRLRKSSRNRHEFLTVLSIFVFLAATTVSYASPEQSADRLARNAFQGEHGIRVRSQLRSAMTRSYERVLSEVGARIADPVRFAELIPDTAIQSALEAQISRVKSADLEAYDPDDLVSLDAFLLSPLGRKYMESLVWLSDGPNGIIRPPPELTPYEQSEVDRFLSSSAGKSWRENGLRVGLVAFFAHLDTYTPDGRPIANIKAPFLLLIVETPGVLEFSNFLQKRDFVSELVAAMAKNGQN